MLWQDPSVQRLTFTCLSLVNYYSLSLLFLSCPACSPVAECLCTGSSELPGSTSVVKHLEGSTPGAQLLAVLAEVQKLASKCLSKLFFWARKRCGNSVVSSNAEWHFMKLKRSCVTCRYNISPAESQVSESF